MSETSLSEKCISKTVLVVEDSPTQAAVIQELLEKNGLDVVCAFDGLSGLKKALEIIPKLIVMDVNMPGMNGFQVVQELKKNPKSTGIPIVLLTSRDTPESLIMGLGAGAIDYIPKDIYAMDVLLGTVRELGLI